MFKKAKYRWQIKSSNRSNQLMGLDEDGDGTFEEDDVSSLIECIEQSEEDSPQQNACEQSLGQLRKRYWQDDPECTDSPAVKVAHIEEDGQNDMSMCDSIDEQKIAEVAGDVNEVIIDCVEKSESKVADVWDTHESMSMDSSKRLLQPNPTDKTEPVPENDLPSSNTGAKAERTDSFVVNLDTHCAVSDSDKLETNNAEWMENETPCENHGQPEMKNTLDVDEVTESPQNGIEFTQPKTKNTPHDNSSDNIPPASETMDEAGDISTPGIDSFNSLLIPKSIEEVTVHIPATAPRRLTYMERWRCQHIAKSMVDNAINKTLEESGLSPNPQPIPADASQQNVETEGVSHAIRMVGLRPRYSPSSMQRLHPIINRLTQVSENIFAANLRNRERNREAEANGTSDRLRTSISPPPYQSEQPDVGQEHNHTTDKRPTMTFQPRTGESDRPKPHIAPPILCEHGTHDIEQLNHCDQCLNNYPKRYSPQHAPMQLDRPSFVHDTKDLEREEDQLPLSLINSEGAQPAKSKEEVNESDKSAPSGADIHMPTNVIPVNDAHPVHILKDQDCISDERSSNDSQGNLSTSFLLDTAVSFAINEKGLQLN